MARIIIIGGGIGGLTSSMLLARDGHRVTVLERDPAPPPRTGNTAWESWERTGVNQFRLPHLFLARFRHLLDAELPELTKALDAAGALRINPLSSLGIAVQPGDERFEMITGRRPVVEAVLATVAAEQPGVEIIRGAAVRALIADRSPGVALVAGVVTADGTERRADLVVDAGGRRSSVPDMLVDAGLRPPTDEAADCGFVYYGRHFRGDGDLPATVHQPLQPYDSLSTLTLVADNGHWSVTLTTSAKDAAMRRTHDPEVWNRIARSYPMLAPWLDAEPITEVDVMAKIEDRVRSYVIDGQPIVTGLVALGDAWACTNPSIGRGASLALLHAACLRDVLRDVDAGAQLKLARRWWDVTAEVVEPLVGDTLAFDRHRLAQIDAEIAGATYEVDDPSWNIGTALRLAAPNHPDLMRAMVSIAQLLERGVDAMSRPGMFDTLMATPPADPPPGPSRAELLEMLAV